MSDIFTQLADRMPDSAIKFRKGSANKDKSKNRVLVYVDARDVQARLDDVVGHANWQDKYIRFDGGFICELSIRVDGEWITKSGVGEDRGDTSEDNAIKSAESDALKRAAVKFGIARHLYTDKISPMWVPKAVPDWEVTATLEPAPKGDRAPLPSSTRPRTLNDDEVAELESLFQEASGSEDGYKELKDRCLFKYNIRNLANLPYAKFDTVRDYLKKLAREPETTPAKPATPSDTINGWSFNNLNRRMNEAYGPRAGHYAKLHRQTYGVKSFRELTQAQYNELLVIIGKAQLGAQNGNGSTSTNGHKPTVDTKSAPFKAFMADGNNAYGKQWNTERKRIIGVVTDGRTDSSKELYADELGAAREMVKAEFSEMVAGMTAQGEGE